MPSVEERISHLESKIGTAPPWEERLKSVEKAVAAHPEKEKDFWDKLQALGSVFSGLVSGLVIFGVGWWLNDKVNHALEQKKVELAYVKDMRDLLVEFGKAETQSVADANAIALASYGEAAIGPLLYRLAAGGDVSEPAAEKGLWLLAFSHQDAVCGRLQGILADSSRTYTWSTHQSVIRLMAGLNCVRQRPTLVSYQGWLKDPDFATRLSESMPVDGESIGKLQGELKRSLSILKP